ncbi:MAG: hypothetical protein JWO03_3204, partial [Bacteroidetes bacterium]|nr:hypothetical protein [Bacteroidota bacterium]
MKLSSITLNNFRLFEHQSFEF